MSSASGKYGCDSESVSLYAVGALPASEVAPVEAHIATCVHCRDEFEVLRWVVDSFRSSKTGLLQPSESLWQRLDARIAQDTDGMPLPGEPQPWPEPEWEDVGPGISCQVMARDGENDRVTMLVRLAPGAEYPPHTHAGIEELYLLWGELWINNRKLYPGDYNRGERGASDWRVWSETGCTCVLITSTRDKLR